MNCRYLLFVGIVSPKKGHLKYNTRKMQENWLYRVICLDTSFACFLLYKFLIRIWNIEDHSIKKTFCYPPTNVFYFPVIGLTFTMRLRAQPFLWKWVLFAWEWKVISISKAEHLPAFWNRGLGELGNGLFERDDGIIIQIFNIHRSNKFRTPYFVFFFINEWQHV